MTVAVWPSVQSQERLPGSLVRLPQRLMLAGIPREIAVDIFDIDEQAPMLGHVHIDASLGPQRYRLTLTADGPDQAQIEIQAGDLAAVRYALATLWSIRQSGRPIGSCQIDDQPRFVHRGVLIDISRDRIPNLNELQR